MPAQLKSVDAEVIMLATMEHMVLTGLDLGMQMTAGFWS